MPLDDANIGRFNEVVREIAQTSQVVLVTITNGRWRSRMRSTGHYGRVWSE